MGEFGECGGRVQGEHLLVVEWTMGKTFWEVAFTSSDLEMCTDVMKSDGMTDGSGCDVQATECEMKAS